MILKVCAIFDGAIQAYARPVFVPAIGAATRSFMDEVRRKGEDNQLHNHPEDFSLYHLADFNEETGKFSMPEDGPVMLIRGKDVQE